MDSYFYWEGEGAVPYSIIDYATKNPGTRIRCNNGQAYVSQPEGKWPFWQICPGCSGVEEQCPDHGTSENDRIIYHLAPEIERMFPY